MNHIYLKSKSHDIIENIFRYIDKTKLIMNIYDHKTKRLSLAVMSLKRSEMKDVFIKQIGRNYITELNNSLNKNNLLAKKYCSKLASQLNSIRHDNGFTYDNPLIDKSVIDLVLSNSLTDLINASKFNKDDKIRLGAFFYYLNMGAYFELDGKINGSAYQFAHEIIPNFEIVDVEYIPYDESLNVDAFEKVNYLSVGKAMSNRTFLKTRKPVTAA